jgi:Lon protease-like protein
MAGSTTEIPLFPLRTVLFPGMELPLRVFEPRYRQMLRDVIVNRNAFGVVLIRSGSEVGGGAVPHLHGTQAAIEDMQQLADGQILLQTRGTRRFRVVELLDEQPYPRGLVQFLDNEPGDPHMLPRVMEAVRHTFPEYFRLSLALTDQWARGLDLPEDPHLLVDTIGPLLQVDEPLKQGLLEDEAAVDRLMRLSGLLDGLIEVLRVQAAEHYRRRYHNTGAEN